MPAILNASARPVHALVDGACAHAIIAPHAPAPPSFDPGALVKHVRPDLAQENARLLADARRQAAAREHVLRVVSQDLRTPLALIRTAAATISHQARRAGEQEEGLTRAAEAIQRAARRMSRLLQDLAEAEQIDTGRLELRLVRQPIAPIVEQAVEAYRPVAAEQGLRLRVEAAAPALTAPCDRERLLQVLGHLLDNACRATPVGGLVSVEVRRQRSRLIVEVADTGRGIAPEDLPHVFDRGWTREAEDSLGLGLFVARALVEGHGGALSVQSEPGRGSRFSVSLPASIR